MLSGPDVLGHLPLQSTPVKFPHCCTVHPITAPVHNPHPTSASPQHHLGMKAFTLSVRRLSPCCMHSLLISPHAVRTTPEPHATGGAVYAQGGTRTWGDCWRCYYPNFVKRQCEASPPGVREAFRGCSPPSLPTTHVAYYAAQLAWWLRFFPPERFLIISSWQLHDPVERIRVRCSCCACCV